MRREHAPLAGPRERVVERDSRRDVVGRELERRERRMALVEVEDARLDPERAERPYRADPEQPVLPEARERVALVEARGDPPVDRVVLVELGVEEVERDAADLDPPDVERDVAARRAGTSSRSGAPSSASTWTVGRCSGTICVQYSCWRPVRSTRCWK